MLNMLLVTPTITMMKILMRCVHYECALLMIPFPLLHNENRPAQPNEKCLGAVHILHQPKSGVPGSPPPSAMVSIWLTPSSPWSAFVSNSPTPLLHYNFLRKSSCQLIVTILKKFPPAPKSSATIFLEVRRTLFWSN